MVVNWKRVSFARPVWKDIRGAVELGRQIAVSRMAWYAYTYSDGVIVGRILGHDPLGSYRMSMNLASAPAEKVSTLLMRTAGPLFANIQNDLVLVRRYYLIFAEALCLTVIPLMTGLIVLSPVAVPLVLGKQWTSAVAPLQWLSAFVILRTLSTLTDQVLMSQRLTQLSMRMSLLSLVVMPIAFYFAARSNGTVGVALSWLVLAPITILPSQIIMMRRIHLPFRDFAGAFWPAAASSAVMALGLYGVRHWAARLTLPVAASLALQIAVGCAIYALFLFVVFRAKVFRYINFVRDMRSKKDVPDSAPA
jgi:O-antigen/teichoic acid export membrane protein